MNLFVLDGADLVAVEHRRRELLGGYTNVEHVDVSLDGGAALVGAVSSPALFGPARVVQADQFDALTPVHAKALVAAAAHSDALVVARLSGALPPSVRRTVKPVAVFEKFAAVKGSSLKKRVRDLARRRGVTLSTDAVKVLTERAGHALDRVDTVLAQCEMAGIDQPTVRQLTVLLGTAAKPAVPWSVTDALRRGDVGAAIAAADELEPMQVLGWLGSQVWDASLVAEAGCATVDDAAAVLNKPVFSARAAFELGRNMGAGRLRQVWPAVMAAQLGARGGVGGSVAVTLLLAQIGPWWVRRAARG